MACNFSCFSLHYLPRAFILCVGERANPHLHKHLYSALIIILPLKIRYPIRLKQLDSFIIGRMIVKTDAHLGPSVLSGIGGAAIYAAVYLSLHTIAAAADASSTPHLEKCGNVTQLIVDGEPFLALAGEL
jgi:hypothetical protein